MIRLPELLEDSVFKEYLTKIPSLGVHRQPPWRLYVQRQEGGGWARKDFEKYPEAFRTLAKLLKAGSVYDGTIQCKPIGFRPPHRVVRVTRNGQPVMLKSRGGMVPQTALVSWKPKLGTHGPHIWCPYCRRPTEFKWFRKHHAVKEIFDPSVRRCSICGVSEALVRSTPQSFLKVIS